jgi:hypothetical protein
MNDFKSLLLIDKPNAGLFIQLSIKAQDLSCAEFLTINFDPKKETG